MEYDHALKKDVLSLARRLGADLAGIGEMGGVREYIRQNYGGALEGYPGAVSLAVFFPPEIINLLTEGPQQIYSHYYEVLNRLLDTIALSVANHLYKKGYRVFPVPASQQLIHDRYKGIFSHKLAASLAGLGWIGKSCCLINEKVGPRLRLATILTDAPLAPDGGIANRCGTCRACVDACPPGAILGKSFKLEEDIGFRFQAERCDNYFTEVKERHGLGHCGKCLAVCPWGKVPPKREYQEISRDAPEKGEKIADFAQDF